MKKDITWPLTIALSLTAIMADAQNNRPSTATTDMFAECTPQRQIWTGKRK
jgi:hypothetical protein